MVRRRIKTMTAVLAGAAAMGMLLAGCSAPGQHNGAQASGSSGPIKIAIVDAQSGQLSSLGDWEAKGAKLAFDQQNAAGGIDGRKIAYTVYDDQGDPTVSTNLARKLASDGNIAMIGTAESADALAMAPVMAQNKIPMITSGQSPKLGQLHNAFVFLNSPSSTAYDETLAKYLVNDKSYKSIAMISNNGAYGAGERSAFGASLKGLGVTPVADLVVTPDQKDFSSALTQIRAKQPAVLFIGAEEVETGLIVKQARQLGIRSVIASGAPAGTPVYVTTAGVDNAAGTVVSTPYLGNDTNDQTKKFAADYQAKYNDTAELHGAKAYDGAQILIKALENSKVATGQKLSDAIRAVSYDGLVGHFAFDANGIGVHETKIGVIDKSGKLVPVNG